MLESILRFSIRQRWIVMAFTLAVALVGVSSYQQLPIDAVPDITNVQVQINTDAPGYTPLEVEQRITFPVETAMAGLPSLDFTRSISRYGLSQVTVVLRPERLSLSRDVHRNGFDNTVPARIDKTIYSGNEMHYLLRLSNSALWKVRVPNSGAEQKRFLTGEAVFVRWNADEGVVLPE